MKRGRRGPTPHPVPWLIVRRTSIAYDGSSYVINEDDGITVSASSSGEQIKIGTYASRHADALVVKLTPGCETYYQARAYRGEPFDDSDVVAAAIVAAIAGHPDAAQAHAGTELRAVWSHHLAIVGRDDPRRVATTYAPTETKSISPVVQHVAALGVEVIRPPDE